MITDIQMTKPNFDINVVIQILNQETLNITTEMAKALMICQAANLENFPQMAARHINFQFEAELFNSDKKIQMVYKTLFDTTQNYIHTSTLPFQSMFLMMGPNSDTFLGSFVLKGTKRAVEIFKLKQPEALERTEIWQ